MKPLARKAPTPPRPRTGLELRPWILEQRARGVSWANLAKMTARAEVDLRKLFGDGRP